ncbi:MAG TPA: hypothetical protein VH593_16580, partial [Ktedonobacteraceae bacterium]
MNKDQIVIVTSMHDSHADSIIMMLQEMGHEPVRLNIDDLPLNTTLVLGFENGSTMWKGSISILTNNRTIDVEAIRSIWWRRPGAFGLPMDLSEQENAFASDEIDHVLRGLWGSLKDECYWIS